MQSVPVLPTPASKDVQFNDPKKVENEGPRGVGRMEGPRGVGRMEGLRGVRRMEGPRGGGRRRALTSMRMNRPAKKRSVPHSILCRMDSRSWISVRISKTTPPKMAIHPEKGRIHT